MSNIEMVIDGIRVSLMNQQRVVILKEKEGERYLPCWIGPSEADAIAVQMQGVSVPRPLTHDFVCAIINNLGGAVKEAVIDKLKDDCFYAKLVIGANKKEAEIDCRPSDALAVAVRLGIPIFADEKVLKKAGIYLDPETGNPLEQPPESKVVPAKKIDVEPSRFEIFSESAQDILNQAESEAKRLNQNFISTGHLLLALLKEGNIATEVLKNMCIDLVMLQTDIEASITEQPRIEENESGLTSAVKNTIQLSVDEAKHLGSEKVKPEHLLTGLVRQNDGIAAKLLKKLMIDPERIYIELIRLYTRPWSQQQSPSN